jgi:clan AA aspartic protease
LFPVRGILEGKEHDMADKILTVRRGLVATDSAVSNKEAPLAENKEYDMGEVRTEITLVNIGDAIKARDGFIPESEVRRLTVNAVVDTGAWTLIINEETREKLGLLVEETSETTVAGGGKVPSRITEPVRVYWKNRRTTCEAVVLPSEEDVLLGAYPLEGLDLMIHPKTQEVVGAHGDKIRNVVK